jgi:ankyrin repeat protein
MNVNKLSKELLLEYLKTLTNEQLKNQCSTNRKFRRICKEHEDEIYKNLLLRDFGEWTQTPKLIYNALSTGYVFKKEDQHIILESVINQNSHNQLHALLKEYKFDVETKIRGKTLLQYAVMKHNLPIECINVLLDFNANIDAIMFGGSTPFVYLLSDDTGDVPSELLLRMIALNPKQEIFMDTIFHIGFKNNTLDASVIDKLLSIEFDINQQNSMNDTPLHLLIELNSDKLTQKMIKRVIQLVPDYNLQNLLGDTVLMLAVKNYLDNAESLGFFLSNILGNESLNINITNSSLFSAIMYAIENDSFPSNIIQKMLKRPELELDSHINQVKQQTLLMQCVSHNSANDLYDVIMSRNPSINVIDIHNNTAAMIAVKKRKLSHANVFDLIQKTDNLFQLNLEGYTLLEMCLYYIKSNIINDIVQYILSKITNLDVTDRIEHFALSNRYLIRSNKEKILGYSAITTSESESY